MKNERTLIILKPDVVARGVTGEIIARFEKLGLKIVAMKMMHANLETAKEHYKKDDEWLLKKGKQIMQTLGVTDNEDPKKYGQSIVDNLSSDLRILPTIAIVLEGFNAVKNVKKLVGPTNPEEAMPGTIRGDYSQDAYLLANTLNRPVINMIHCTDDPKEAEREINLWFKKEEIHDWVKLDESLLYRKGK